MKIVREKFPNDLIRSGIDFDGKFIFGVSPGKQLIQGDLAAFYAIVDKMSGKLTSEAPLYFIINLPKIKKKQFYKAWNNCRYVDITKEDLERL